MRKSLVVMNFSGVYSCQSFYREVTGWELVLLDCSALEGTNCYCDIVAEKALAGKMAALGAEGIHFIDSGNYHYLSKLWMDSIREPFDLILFDHHTDMQEPLFGRILSCGGWVKEALGGNDRLRRVCVVGPPAEAIRADSEEIYDYEGRIFWIASEEDNKSGRLEDFLKDAGPVYISIDKDILCGKDAKTNWDQGEMELAGLLRLLEAVVSRCRVIGVDVCGERAPGEDQEADITNGEANARLLGFFMQTD